MSEFNSKEYLDNGKTEVGSPDQAKRYLDIANSHGTKSREFERKANDLESQIRRKLQPASRMSEVNSLRRQAEGEKREAEKYKRYAETELRKPTYGGLANEFGEQTEKNRSDLSKIKEGKEEKQEDIHSVDDAFQNSENTAKRIIQEISSVSINELAKKFDLSQQDADNLSETDSMFNGDISFKGIKGYKKGVCSGREIPIYD